MIATELRESVVILIRSFGELQISHLRGLPVYSAFLEQSVSGETFL